MVEKIKEKRKILVIGSSGMLGVDLCVELGKTYDVIGLDMRTINPDHIACDITNKEEFFASVKNANPELIIHTAALTQVDGCEKDPKLAKKINVEGTANVSGVAAELDVPLIYISTDFVFDGKSETAYVESDAPNPVNVYAETKLAGEKIVAELKRYIIIRAGWLYGSAGKNFVDAILNIAKGQKEITVVDDQIGCPTYTKDLVIAINKLLGLLKKDVQDIYHISNSGSTSWYNYAREIIKLSNVKDVKVVPIKSDELRRPARRPSFSVLDNTKFENKTGYKLRSWKKALGEYLNDQR